MPKVIEINQRAQCQPLSERAIWERQDVVDNAVHNLIEELIGTKCDWEMEITGDVREAIVEVLEHHGIIKADEFYPSATDNNDDDDDVGGLANFAETVAEFRASPLKIILEFAALVLTLLAIIYGLPLIFG